jgi:hypothetical protein
MFACVIAARKEPAPESFVFVTGMFAAESLAVRKTPARTSTERRMIGDITPSCGFLIWGIANSGRRGTAGRGE